MIDLTIQRPSSLMLPSAISVTPGHQERYVSCLVVFGGVVFGAGEKFILSPGSKWFMYVGWVSKVFLLISFLQSWGGMIPFDWHIFIKWVGLTIG